MSTQVTGISGASGNATNENYTLVSGYDIYDRDFYKKLIKKVPRASALKWMRGIKGYMSKRTTRRHTYYFHEEGQWFNTVCTIAVASDQTTFTRITLSAADHDNTGTTSYPVVGQLVVFTNESVGYVSAVSRASANAHTVDVYPVDTSNNNILAAASVGSKISFYSNAQKEKSTKTQHRTPKTDKITNYVQTFREYYEVTDHAMQNHTEFEYKGKTMLHVKGIDEMTDRFEAQEELGLLITPASSSLVDAGSAPIQLAKGFIPQITDSGNTMEYYGTPDMTTADDAILILNKAYGAEEYMIGQAIDSGLGWKNWLVDFASGGDNGVNFSGSITKEQALHFNFRQLSIEGYSFNMSRWDCLSHTDSLGATDMPYRNMIIFIPIGVTKNPEPGEGQNDYEPYIQLVYSDPGGAPHQNKGDHALFSEGALAPGGATSDGMYWGINMVSYKSLEIRCRNKFLIARKAA